MAFLSSMGSAIGGMFSGAGGAAGSAGLSGAAGSSLAPAAMASSMGYGAPVAAGAAASATPAAAAAGSSGFMSGLAGASGLMTDGKFDSTKAGGMVGSMLGQSLMQGGQGTPQASPVNLADMSSQVQQALKEKPWATPSFDASSYINDLLRGG